MTALSGSFLEHASQCSSQYDETCRTMAAEILSLRKSLTAIMELINTGKLVRDISRDSEPDWALQQIVLIRTLASAQAALAKTNDLEVPA